MTKRGIGWREWIALPDLGIEKIKVKIDTGARSSVLHTEELSFFKAKGQKKVRFAIYPIQRNNRKKIIAEAHFLGFRYVRSSSGHEETRPVIQTNLEINGLSWPIEITLTNRDIMGFRMLLGRKALKGFVILPNRSFLLNKKIIYKKLKGSDL